MDSMDLSALRLDNASALRLVNEGAAVLLLDVPVRCSFTIDYVTYTTGEMFKGVKMIPPGVHFISLSAPLQPGQAGPSGQGWFYDLPAQSVLVRQWDEQHQGLSELSDSKQAERLALGVRRFDFDSNLAAYALDKYQRWRSLSSYITSDVLKRLQYTHYIQLSAQKYDLSNKLAPETTTATTSTTTAATTSTSSSSSSVSSASPQLINEVKFSQLPSAPTGSLTPSEVTKMHMDKSWQLSQLVKQYGKGEGVLGELQYAFVLFLLGHDYQGFEQWKALVIMCCACQEAIVTNTSFFVQFVQVLTAQLDEVPKDFFLDPLSSDNFLKPSLQSLYEVSTPPYPTVAMAESPTVLTEHLTQLERFAAILRTLILKKFGWDIGLEDDVEPVE